MHFVVLDGNYQELYNNCLIFNQINKTFFLICYLDKYSFPSRTFFRVCLTSADLKICPYHMSFLRKILKFFSCASKKILLRGEQLTTTDFCVEKRLKNLKKLFKTFVYPRAWARIWCTWVRLVSNRTRYPSTWAILETPSLASRCVHITWPSCSRCSCSACAAQSRFDSGLLLDSLFKIYK